MNRLGSSSRAVPPPDGVELADVVRTLRRQWRAVAGFTALGVLTGLAVIAFAPRRYEARASILARGGTGDAAGSLLGRIGSVGDLIRGGGLGLSSQFESELELLRSRAVAGQVLDSLQLQFSVREPDGLPPSHFIADSDLRGRFAPRKYRFDRQSDGSYRVRAGEREFTLVPGTSAALDIGAVTLRATTLPSSFVLKIFDREDAITRLSNRIEVGKVGGEVAEIEYLGEDSITAALVPNLVVANYLDRRRTVDRGVNQRRVEYVTTQLEATASELAATERALREHQESSGVFDAQMLGAAELEGAIAMRESLTVVQVEEGALRAMLTQAREGRISAQQLAAYPTFLRGTSVSQIVGELNNVEAQRIRLLERRMEQDPEVMVLDRSREALEAQIMGMAGSYADALAKRRDGLVREVKEMQRTILALPAAAERGGRMQRDILRLSQIYTALQAQLVEARLAAIGEGGDVRQVDVAAVPRKAAFPAPLTTMTVGTFGGFMAGIISALFLGWFGRWLRDPVEIERLTGVSVQRVDDASPLLLMPAASRTILLVPLATGARADAVAERLARTAAMRSLSARVVDLASNGTGNGTAAHSAALLDELEREANGSMVVVQLPDLSSDIAIAAMRESRPVLLVAPPGPVDRTRLGEALDTLKRLEVPCAGVVISDAPALRAFRA